jgi:predicted Rossmann fold flavoprotein
VDNGKVSADEGELQLTEYGISGIPVFNVSRYAIRALEEGKRVTALLDFFPEFDEKGLSWLWESRKERCPYKTTRELLTGLFPDKLCDVLWKSCRGDEGALLSLIKGFSLKVSGYQRERAQVYSGGIPLAEVDYKSLQSKVRPGVYLCGEVLDVDGRCGGYNLQWAWSSGYLAGISAAEGESC